MPHEKPKAVVKKINAEQSEKAKDPHNAELKHEDLRGVSGGTLGANTTIHRKHIAGVKYS